MGAIYVSEGLCRKGSDYDKTERSFSHGWSGWRFVANEKNANRIKYVLSKEK